MRKGCGFTITTNHNDGHQWTEETRYTPSGNIHRHAVYGQFTTIQYTREMKVKKNALLGKHHSSKTPKPGHTCNNTARIRTYFPLPVRPRGPYHNPLPDTSLRHSQSTTHSHRHRPRPLRIPLRTRPAPFRIHRKVHPLPGFLSFQILHRRIQCQSVQRTRFAGHFVFALEVVPVHRQIKVWECSLSICWTSYSVIVCDFPQFCQICNQTRGIRPMATCGRRPAGGLLPRVGTSPGGPSSCLGGGS